ncbi:MAG: glycosyltransferase [Acidobacteriota bacterium]
MSRILVLGAAPLPFEPRERQYAPNLRTWHFTKPLVGDGHEIRLVAGRVPNTYPDDVDDVIVQSDRGFEYVSVVGSLFQNAAYIQQHCQEFQPDAILGVNTHPSSRAVSIDTDKPIWCDLNGWVMAEAQAKCRVYGDDRYLSHFWKMEREILDRADVISTVSDAQAFATVGELATRGRLAKENFGYNFVHTIPNALSEVEFRHDSRVFRGGLVPEGAFVVLWAGGYNTWTDVDLLFEALTAAMEAIPDLHYVSTGGVIEGHDELTFNRFLERIRSSEFGDRFHFAGWVPTADVPSYYFESDLGINVDSDNYETVFGARNRLNEWLKVGLPVLTTSGTEISKILADNHLGLTCPSGDTAAFGERLIWAARNREDLKKMAEKAQAFALEQFSYGRTTEPLREWARSPMRAPDKAVRVEFQDIDFYSQQPEKADLEHRLMHAQEQLGELEAQRNEARHQLGVIHQSKMWRLWIGTIAVRRWLLRPLEFFRIR